MLSSPFQQPSRRQNALALQIQEARTTGDDAMLSRLISQWVHRYGFNGAVELDLSLPELTVSEPAFPLEGVAEEPSCAPESLAEANEVVMQVMQNEVEVEEEEEGLAEDEVVVQEAVAKHESVVEGDVLEEEAVVAEATELQRSFKPGLVPAPPISTPRSLRRWLPRRENDAFPKAS